MNNNNRPAFHVRFFPISIAIWEEIQDNRPQHSMQITKAYKDKDGKWQNTNTLWGSDLAIVAVLIPSCLAWCTQQIAEHKARGSQNAGQTGRGNAPQMGNNHRGNRGGYSSGNGGSQHDAPPPTNAPGESDIPF